MQPAPSKTRLWLGALQQWSVWRRGLTLGLGVGVLQAVVNQGDHWIRHEINVVMVVKTLVSPLITFSVALVSAAATYVEKNSRNENYERLEVQA